MKKLLLLFAVGAAAFSLGNSGVVFAISSNEPPTPSERSISGASAKYARLSVHVDKTGFVFRSKGVRAVTHPSVGQFCITPSGSYDVRTVLPSISIDWSTSLGNDLRAYYKSTGSGCQTGDISIVTYNNVSGRVALSNSVGFIAIVP